MDGCMGDGSQPTHQTRRHPHSYFAFSTIRTTRQRFSLDIGRVSMISTVSPGPHSLFWSCALNFVVRRIVLPYSGCRMRDSIATTTVCTILLLRTTPIRVFRLGRPDGGFAGAFGASFLAAVRRG